MHEMGVVLNIVQTAEQLARENQADCLGFVTVEVGQLSGVVPNYLQQLWPIGTKGTLCEGAELRIEEICAMVRCRKCGTEYPLMKHVVGDRPICPHCRYNYFSILEGRDVTITELGVPE